MFLRLLLCSAMLASFLGALMSGWFYYFFYWRHRGNFNEAGRYFDPVDVVVYHEQSWFWILPALVLLALALLFLRLWWRVRR
jgi:hypothetical protein